MKILVTWSKWNIDIGESLVSAFSALGHDASIFYDNPKNFREFILKIFNKLRFNNLYKYFIYSYRRKVGDELYKRIEKNKPDLVFVIGGMNFLPETIKEIRDKLNISVANWVIDDPSIPANVYEYPMLQKLSAYSHIFLVDESWGDYLIANNKNNIFYLPHAVDKNVFYPMESKKDIDVFFLGSLALKYPNTASGIFRGIILDSLVGSGFNITAVIPDGYKIFKEFPRLKKMKIISRLLKPEEVNKFYNRSKIILNINAPQLKTDFSERLFSITASNNFQIVDYKNKLNILFPDDSVIYFRDLRELKEKMSFYLKNESKRADLSMFTYKHSLGHHTYKHRAEEIIKRIYENK